MRKYVFGIMAIMFSQMAAAGCAEGSGYTAYHIKNGKTTKQKISINNCASMVNVRTTWFSNKWAIEKGAELATSNLTGEMYAVGEYLVLNGKKAVVVKRPKNIAKRFMCVALPKNTKEIYCVDTQHELY